VIAINRNSLNHVVHSLPDHCYQLLHKKKKQEDIHCEFRIREDIIAEGNIVMCLQLSMLQRTEQHRVQ